MTACANKQVLVGKKCMQDIETGYITTTKSYIWILDKSKNWSEVLNKENCL
tara:strand:+ start:377 stop:529 length:153 start_codon:yes stop_codon:yes gene_type:complete